MISSATFQRSPMPPTNEPPTGYESPDAARDGGWLGQVPPPPEPPVAATPKAPPSYANPQAAPDPWISPPPLYTDDPTLFG